MVLPIPHGISLSFGEVGFLVCPQAMPSRCHPTTLSLRSSHSALSRSSSVACAYSHLIPMPTAPNREIEMTHYGLNQYQSQSGFSLHPLIWFCALPGPFMDTPTVAGSAPPVPNQEDGLNACNFHD